VQVSLSGQLKVTDTKAFRFQVFNYPSSSFSYNKYFSLYRRISHAHNQPNHFPKLLVVRLNATVLHSMVGSSALHIFQRGVMQDCNQNVCLLRQMFKFN
jgi:hypothetical protein